MICTRCKRKHNNTTVYCNECLAYFVSLRKLRKANNKCTKCGVPLTSDIDEEHSQCMNCRQWRTI